MALSGREEDEGANDDATTSVVVAAHVATSLEARRRALAAAKIHRPRYRGPVPGRISNRPRNFALGLQCILSDYFGVDGLPPVFGREQFERRFRVRMAVFLRIYRAIKDRPFWVQRVHATGQPQAHPLQKLVAVFRVLAYGESYDRADEYVRYSRSTIATGVKLFTEFMVDDFGPLYLRPPTRREIESILARNSERGLPGCLGSLDCSHWEWSSCPKARAGTYQGRDGRRSIVIEAICDEDTWIYHIFAGSPGSLNDIIVLYQSPMYMDAITGKWPPRDYSFTVNGNTGTLLYYLVDGISPRFASFVAPYPNPRTPEQRTFNRLQEALRKDVERLFGILLARFHVMLHPCRMWTVPCVVHTTETVTILHNMVVEARRGKFFSRSRFTHYGAGGADGAGGGGVDPAAADGAGVGGAPAGGSGGAAVGVCAADAVGGAGAGADAADGAGVGGGPAGGGGGAAVGIGAVDTVGTAGAGAGAADGAGAGGGPAGDDGGAALGVGEGEAGGAGAGAGAADGAVAAGAADSACAAGATDAVGVGDGTGGGTGPAGVGGTDGVGGAGAGSGVGVIDGAGFGSGGTGGAREGGDEAWGAGAGGAADGGGAGTAAGGLAGLGGAPGYPPPAVGAAGVAPMSEFMRILVATGETKCREEHETIREDRCAHVFAQRGELQDPYVD